MRESFTGESILRIAVCDDDAAFAGTLVKRLNRHLDNAGIRREIACVSSGEALLDLPELSRLHLLFLDIQMKGISGLEAAKAARARNRNLVIIFVTEFLEYAPEGYEVCAFRYIVKSKLAPVFDGVMDAVIHQLGYNRASIELEFTTGKRAVFTDEIAYAESAKHAIDLYDFSGASIGRVYMRLDELENGLPRQQFVRTHQSFLVNIEAVSSLQQVDVALKNGTAIPVSRRKYPEVKNRFYLYLGDF